MNMSSVGSISQNEARPTSSHTIASTSLIINSTPSNCIGDSQYQTTGGIIQSSSNSAVKDLSQPKHTAATASTDQTTASSGTTEHTTADHNSAAHKPANRVPAKKMVARKADESKPDCVECGVTFASIRTFKRHVKRVHNGIFPKSSSSVEISVGCEQVFQRIAPRMKLECIKCGITFSNHLVLRQHMERTHGSFSSKTILPAIVSCPVCKEIVCKPSLTHHMKIAHRMTPGLKCHYCNVICPDLKLLEQHMNLTHPDSREPGTKLVEESDKLERTARKPESYNLPDQVTGDDTVVETSVLVDGKVIAKCKIVDGKRAVCSICSAKIIDLLDHLRQKHELTRAMVTVCHFCGCVFPGKAEFDLHMKSDHPLDSTSRSSSGSIIRLGAGTTNDRIKCPICQNMYQRSSYISHLIQYHLFKGIKQCENCLSVFADERSLEDHMDYAHPDLPRIINSGLDRVEFAGDRNMTSKTGKESVATSETEAVQVSEGSSDRRIGGSSSPQRAVNSSRSTTDTTSKKSKAVVRRQLGIICHICFKSFPTQRELLSHSVYKHSDKGHATNLGGQFVCQKCGISCSHKNILIQHMVKKHFNGGSKRCRSRCRICHKMYDRLYLKSHYRRKHQSATTVSEREKEGDNNSSNRLLLTKKDQVTENVDKSCSRRCHICLKAYTIGVHWFTHVSRHISLGTDKCLKINRGIIEAQDLQTFHGRQRRHFTGRRDDWSMDMMMRPPPNMKCEICHDSFSRSALHVVKHHPFVVGLASTSLHPEPATDLSHCVGYECSICYQTLETPDDFTVHMWAVHATSFDLREKERYTCRWPYATLIKAID